MKENEFLDGVSNIEPDVVERFISMDNKLQKKANKLKSKGVWLRLGAIAACFTLIVSAIIVAPMLRETGRNIQTPSSAPHYYGSESSSGMSMSGQMEVDPAGISVTAKLIKALPDTYTFFDDWTQDEFRLLRMRTIKLLKGQEMTKEFYYLIPVEFMTDFSMFESFVIKNMAQFTYEYSVMYNKTQGKAEQLNRVIFGYCVYGYTEMGEDFMAFDADGDFDERLWKANDAWVTETERSPVVDTITQAEKSIQNDEYRQDLYVHLLKDISGEAENVLKRVKTFDNGIFVPIFSTNIHRLSPEVQFHAVRYINGFATNEAVSVWSKEWAGGDQDTYAFTQACFNEDDLNALPDLTSAFTTVVNALNNGSIIAPHFNNDVEIRITTSGAFGWYAKTEDGVLGIIRVTWSFYSERDGFCYDDAYYTVESDSDEVVQIDRDDLIEKIGKYEKTYIYTGEYDEFGKVYTLYDPMP